MAFLGKKSNRGERLSFRLRPTQQGISPHAMEEPSPTTKGAENAFNAWNLSEEKAQRLIKWRTPTSKTPTKWRQCMILLQQNVL